MGRPRVLPDHVFPDGFAGVVTTSCECGWEIVSVVPEENDRRMSLILIHLIQAHDLKMPTIQYYAH